MLLWGGSSSQSASAARVLVVLLRLDNEASTLLRLVDQIRPTGANINKLRCIHPYTGRRS